MLPVDYANSRLLGSYPDVLSSHPNHLSVLAFNTGFVFCHSSGQLFRFSAWLCQHLVPNLSLASLVFITDVSLRFVSVSTSAWLYLSTLFFPSNCFDLSYTRPELLYLQYPILIPSLALESILPL